ncbi:30S ribosome-binding factor RbfA [Phenylobacterium sp.]|uniref:30S ribosome-binding factor RbfA n=1 Tax=Phenylobacterium sp. TaxID=1871053 RepID=UPI003983C05D
MKRPFQPTRTNQGPTQRQLRAGELMRHALVEIMLHEEIRDPVMAGVSVTVTEIRMSPDLRHAMVFVEPLGGEHSPEVVDALNRHTKFLRGRLGQSIDMKFTPELKFIHDQTFGAAERMSRLFDDPRVRQDLQPQPPSDAWKDED